MGEFKLGRMTLKSLFSKPATTMYPAVAPTYYPQTKGHVVVDADNCRYDGSCAITCPTGAIEVDRKAYTWSIDRLRCIQCRNCVESCPEKVLYMENTYAAPSDRHTVDVYEVTPQNRAQRVREAREKAERAARLKEEAAKKKAEAAAKKKAEAPAEG